jgi:hypothetical protein
MTLINEIGHRRGQQQRLIDLPRAKCPAHPQGQNLTRASFASKIGLLPRQAPSSDAVPDVAAAIAAQSKRFRHLLLVV